VNIQDLQLPDLLLHIFVQHDQPPRYLDLLNKIKQLSKTEIHDIHDYYMIIKKDQVFKYIFKDDLGLQKAFRSISDQDQLEIKLMKKGKYISYIIPIFTTRPTVSYSEEEELHKRRKDSGISLDEEIEQFKKTSRKLPALSNIITTQLWPPPPTNTTSLPSPPSHYNKSPIKLPGLSSIIIDHSHNSQKQLAPIHPYRPLARFDHKPLSPPLSAPSSPINKVNHHKRARGGASQTSQFICEHVIDTITGKTCCQAFRRSYDLSRHQTIHLKNRPLCYCQDCGKKFTRLDALRRHERIQGHHNNK
ncbi:hypothetical protein INT47_009059, partial [Mucor saturninus]